MIKSVHPILLLALLAACGHDAKRENPLDPELTPAVAVTVAEDDTAGVVRLSWTPHSGESDFAAYWVLRSVAKSTEVDTLVRLVDSGHTTFTDSSLAPATAYVYRVSVLNAGGLEVASAPETNRPLELPRVDGVQLEFDSRSATATLTWSAYEGPNFASYRVRRSTGTARQDVADIADVDVSTFVDSGLVGNTPYAYEVVVVTTAGDEAASQSVAGRFHAFVASWPMSRPVTTPGRATARLYADPGGGVALLSSSPDDVRLVVFDAEGNALADKVLVHQPSTFLPPNAAVASMAVSSAGERLLSFSYGRTQGIMRFDRSGSAIEVRTDLQLGLVPSVESGQIVRGDLRLGTRRDGFFRNLVLSDGSGVLLNENFSFVPQETESILDSVLLGAWQLSGGGSFQRTSDGWLRMGTSEALREDDSAREGYRAEVDAVIGYRATVEIGGDRFSRLSLLLQSSNPSFDNQADLDDGWAELTWRYAPPDGSEAAAAEDSVRVPFAGFYPLSSHLTLSMTNGRPTASVTYPALWNRRNVTATIPRWATLAAIDDHVAQTSGDATFVLDAAGQVVELNPVDGEVSETRAWLLSDEARFRVAVCLPEQNEVRFGTVFRASRWADVLRATIGQRLDDGGFLFYPLSMDAGPDGRMYILDAGNARIVVFDRDGRLITQFGNPGSGDGQFDFGSGQPLAGGLDFAGSIAVDDEGFIYVADVGNSRIQKFAP